MPKYTTENIRNLTVLGSAGSGKTTLIEQILHHAGVSTLPSSIALDPANTATSALNGSRSAASFSDCTVAAPVPPPFWIVVIP